jgi:putative transposase
MTSQRKEYPSDLSDEEWKIVQPHIPHSQSNKRMGGRPEKYPKREVLNALLYVMSSGCRWCDIPHDLPPRSISWHYFNAWSQRKLMKKIGTLLRKRIRLQRERTADPSVLIIDSQTAKGTEYIEDSGYDAGKKTKGRKRHHLTDTQGLLIHTQVHSAAIQDRDGAKLLLNTAGSVLKGIVKIYADGGYAGKLINWVWKKFGIVLEIVKRNELHKFVVLPKRWIIERTNAWISKARRLAKDYEKKSRNQESMIYLRMIQLMVRWVIG